VALLNKVSDGVGILQDVTGSEALVRLLGQLESKIVQEQYADHVKERKVLLLLDEVGKLPPLGLGRVNTGGVLHISSVRVGVNTSESSHVRKHAAKPARSAFAPIRNQQ
jgi:hypothetical protein